MSPIHLGWLLLTLVSFTNVSSTGVPANLPRLCYTSEDQLAPSYVIPCFSGLVDDGDVYGCCIAGDYCSANQTCFNEPRGITYQKGCTASRYDNINCPRKCGTDQDKADWVGLIYCNGTKGTPKDTWICQHPDNCFAPASNCPADHWDPQLEVTRTTYCENIKNDKRWVAFEGTQTPLKATVSLPQPSLVEEWWSIHSNYSNRWHTTSTNGPIDPYAPTNPLETSVDTTISGPSEPTSPGNISAALPQETPSRSQTIGMAIGLGVGFPLILAVIALIYFLRRRRYEAGAGEQFNTWSANNSGGRATEYGKSNEQASKAYLRYHQSNKAELSAEQRPAQIPEMEESSIGDYKTAPMASPLLAKDSGKGHVHNDRSNDAPVYELPG